MPFFHDYPYESYHEMNLDWIIGMIKKLTGEMHDFKVVNQITFWGDWDITKQYPAWSVVNNNGDGYISIKPVPVGIDIANTDYWILVANYSALYADMQNRIVALEGDMSTAQTDIINLKAEKAINAPTLKDRKYIVLGDSYGEGWDPDGTNDGWCKIFKNTLNLDNDHIAYNGYGGSKFSAGGTMSFIYQLQNYINVADDNKITDIIVAGGFNDQLNTDAEIGTGISDFVTYARTTYPFAKIHISFVGWTEDTLNGSGGSTTAAKCTAAYNSYKKHCILNGVHFIPNGIKWAMTQNFSSDFVHPNQNGNTVIAENIILGLESDDSVNLKEAYIPASISMANGITTTDTLYNAYEKGDYIQIKGGYITYTVPGVTVTMDQNGIKLFDSYCPLIKGAYPLYIPVKGFLSTTGGYVNFNGYIEIKNNAWTLVMPDVNSGGYNSYTINAIILCGFEHSIPLFNAAEEGIYPMTV